MVPPLKGINALSAKKEKNYDFLKINKKIHPNIFQNLKKKL